MHVTEIPSAVHFNLNISASSELENYLVINQCTSQLFIRELFHIPRADLFSTRTMRIDGWTYQRSMSSASNVEMFQRLGHISLHLHCDQRTIEHGCRQWKWSVNFYGIMGVKRMLIKDTCLHNMKNTEHQMTWKLET